MSPPPSPSADVPDIAVQVAARLLAEGRADEAAARLTALVTAAPAYPAALVLLARALEASGRDAEALDAWHRAHALVPNSPLVRRERQRLLEADAAAPPGEAVETEPEAPASEPEETPPAESLAAAPAGDLPDAHLALTEAEESPEAMPGKEAIEVPEDVGDGEEPAPASEAEIAAEEQDVTEEETDEPLPAPEPSAEEEDAAEETDAEETDAVEPEPLPAPREDVDEEGVDAPAATAEPPVAPPDVTEPPAEPVAGASESEAAWWHRTPAVPPPEPQEEEGGWSVLEETEAAPPGPEVAEPHIAPPSPSPAPPEAHEEAAVEDARVIPAEEALPDAEPDAPPTLADELDALINRLEDAPRIRPDPTFSGPDVSFEEEDDDDLVSETLARIYAAQRQYAEAAIVYEKLAQQRPGEAEEMLRRAAEMRAQGGG